MAVAEKLEQLARRVPGVAGYLDQERARETDKLVRLRVAGEVETVKRLVEEEERRLTELHHLDHLARLGRLTAKLDKLASLVRFASRGYRGLFDARRPDEERLARLYAFDLGMLDEVERLRLKVADLAAVPRDNGAFEQVIEGIDEAIDACERTFAGRDDVLGAA
jgi:hypothetical protein